VIYFVETFRIPRFTHHSADISAFLDSTFYFPHSTIPHFTNDHPRGVINKPGRPDVVCLF